MQTQATRTGSSGLVRSSVSLFLALSCLYLLLARGRITSVDEWHVYGTAESLAESGSWQMQVPGLDREYSRYSVVPSILGVPFFKLAMPLANRPGTSNENSTDLESHPGQDPSRHKMTRQDILQAAVTLETPFVTAATAAILFFSLCRLAVNRGAALATTMVFAVGTLALPYSGCLYVQPVAALGLICLVGSVALNTDGWAAVSLALVLLVRLEFLALAPVLGLYVWRFRQPVAKSSAWLFGGAIVGTGLNMLINYARGDHLILGDYGSETFSTPIWVGLYGVLFSAGKGLAWFAPVAAAGLALMPWFYRTAPRIGFLAAGVSATLLVMVACWWTWHGGWSWGPRLLVPLMPVLVLPLAWVFDGWPHLPAGFRVAVLAVIIASFAVQFWGVVTDPVGDRATIWPLIGGNENESIYVPQTGPWGVAAQDGPDLLVWRVWQTEPDSRKTVLMVAAGLILTCVGMAAYAIRTLGLPAGSQRAIFPRAQPIDLFSLAAAMLLFTTPSLVEWILLPAGQTNPGTQSDRAPKEFCRFVTDETGRRRTGRLYVPLKGDYMFYEQGPPGTQFFLDERPVFQNQAGAVGVANVSLAVGFHKLDLEAGSPGRFNRLYWTTPGNAHYKEPIPHVYLTGPIITWRERGVIAVTHWKWLIWVTAIVGLVFVSSRETTSRANS